MKREDIDGIIGGLFISFFMLLLIIFVGRGFQYGNSFKEDSVFFVPFSFLFPIPINQGVDCDISGVCQRSESPSKENVCGDSPISEIRSLFNFKECYDKGGCEVYAADNGKNYEVYYIVPKFVGSN